MTTPASIPPPLSASTEAGDALYRILVQNVTDFAIYLLSPEGIITSWNQGAERAKGYRAEEIIGQHFSRFYLPDDRASGLPSRALATARNTGKFEDEGWRLRKDGTRLRAHVVIDPVYDETGTLIGFAKITRDVTEHYETKRAADEQTRNFRLLVQGVADHAIYMLDQRGIIANWNAGAHRLKGYTAEQVVGRHYSLFHEQADRAAGLPHRALATALARGKFEAEGWRIRQDGTRFWALVAIDPLYDETGHHIGFSKITRDLTVQKRHLDETKAARDNLDLALAHMSHGLCLFDARACLVICNDRFRELLEVSPSAFKPGQTYTDLLWLMHSKAGITGEHAAPQVEEAHRRHLQAMKGGTTRQQEYILNDRVIAISDKPLPDGGWVSTVDDVTERREMEREVVHLAHHDALTGLPNRAFLQKRLIKSLTRPDRRSACALLYIDLDRFKQINDNFGRPLADEVLRITARRILGNLRSADTVARVGGDQFVVLYEEVHEDRDAMALAERISRDIARPLPILNGVISASIGVAIAGSAHTDAEILLHHADLAMYAAKDAGRGTCLRYQPGMREALHQRRELEQDLRNALQANNFSLVYQPVVDTRAQTITSFEALLRWEHPERGAVSPAEFIPFAEEIGLMPQIDDWVLQAACLQAMAWPPEIAVAVNLSPTRLHAPGLVETVRQTLAATRLAPERLEIEITETSMIRDLAGSRAVLAELRALGVQIAMDDFGTGYSSLSLLRDIPFTRIKIDRSFIHDLGISQEAAAIVRAITGICDSLSVHVTAEGVETIGQADMLRQEGCYEHQGFFISRPSPAADLPEWIARYAKPADNIRRINPRRSKT